MKFLTPFIIVVLIITSVILGYGIYNQKVFNRSQQGTSPTPPPDVLLQTTPTPANFSPTVFSYDVTKAETLLTQFLKDNIKPQFLPAKIEIKQGQQIDGTKGPENGFNSYYKVNENIISANLRYEQNLNTPDDFYIFVQPLLTKQATATTALANSLLSSYFNNPPSSISNCATKGTTSYCEFFKSEFAGRRGYGIAFISEKNTFIPTVFTCFIPETSKEYPTAKSCIAL